ncbi:ArsR/SmtB family transcription factor [Nocardia sp. NPDC003345]
MPETSPARVFEALGDPVRRRILRLVAAGEQTAGGLVEGVRQHTPISQPAVSQHLRTLREAGLVSVRPEGSKRFYGLDPEGVSIAREWLADLLDPMEPFAQPLDALATEIARGKRERRGREPGGSAGRDTRPA